MQLNDELDSIQKILEEPYKDDPKGIFDHICFLSGLIGRLNKLKAEAEYHLEKARFAALGETDKMEKEATAKMPVYRKEITVDNLTSQEKLAYNIISGMCRASELKITAGQSLLRSITQDKSYGQV